MSDGPVCPQCGTEVRPDWDWCGACGYDPEGLRPAAPAEAAPRRSMGRPAAVVGLAVLAGALLGALAWAVMDHRDEDRQTVAGSERAPRADAEEMADNWWVLEPLDADLTVQLPVRPERTSVEISTPDGTAEVSAWVGNGAGTWIVAATETPPGTDPTTYVQELPIPDLGGSELSETGREPVEVPGAAEARVLTGAVSTAGPAEAVVAVADEEPRAVLVAVVGDTAGFERALSNLRL